MEKAKKRFRLSLVVLIVSLVICFISLVFMIIFPDTATPGNALILLGLANISGFIMNVSFIFGFYFYLKLKEITGPKVFLIWVKTSLIWFIYLYLFILVLQIIGLDFTDTFAPPIILSVMGTINISIITGIIALVVYFKNRKKQNGQ